MKYYPRTRGYIKKIIEGKYGPQTPERDKKNMPAHIMWMIEEMKTFPDTRKGSAKAGRWIGWIFREMEMRGLMGEARYLEPLKKDVENGHF